MLAGYKAPFLLSHPAFGLPLPPPEKRQGQQPGADALKHVDVRVHIDFPYKLTRKKTDV